MQDIRRSMDGAARVVAARRSIGEAGVFDIALDQDQSFLPFC
jgi:hypothetical protein